MTDRLTRIILPTLAALCAPAVANAALMYSTPGAVATENFDGPAGSATTVDWMDDTTLPGWYAYQAGNTEPAGPIAELRTTLGSSVGIVLYRWRDGTSATDHAFGTKPLDANGDLMIAWRITNNTGMTLTEFTLGYTGEQWYGSTGGNNQLVVAYQIGLPANLQDGTWTDVPELLFNSPQDGLLANGSLDGNDDANRVVFAPHTVTGLNWEHGTDLWIRWFDNNSTGTDQGMAIDDLSFSADIPEPASVALLGLGGVLALARRREA